MKIMKIKDFINILLILILTGFAVGITYLQYLQIEYFWALLYLPLIVLMIMLGLKLHDDY